MIGNRARLAIPRDDLIPLRVLCKKGMDEKSRGQPNSIWRFLTAAR